MSNPLFVPMSQNLRRCPKCNAMTATATDEDNKQIVVGPDPPAPPHGLGGPLVRRQGLKGTEVVGQMMSRHECRQRRET